MFRRIFLAAALIFAVAGTSSSVYVKDAFAKEYKIGYVDLARVFDEYKKTKESEKALEDKAKAKEKERQTMLDEMKKLKDEQAILSEKAKAEKQGIIENKIKALQDFERKTRDDLVKERNDMLSTILKQIEGVVNVYATETGYDIILNSRTILFGAEQYDVTNEILRRLNK